MPHINSSSKKTLLPLQGRQKKILQAVEQLVDFPEMGRPGRITNTRELVIAGTPYVVAYRLKGATVRILVLLHGARRWPTQL